MVLSLRRIFFNQILAEEKCFEYRKITPWILSRLKRKPVKIIFHFYTADRLMVDIIKIERIRRPKHLESVFPNETRLLRFKIANPKYFKLE